MTFRNDERSGIAILADDLTSAGDGAAPFRRAGHDARILLTAPASVPRHAVGVSAVDLGSRVLDEKAAASRTRRAACLFAYLSCSSKPWIPPCAVISRQKSGPHARDRGGGPSSSPRPSPRRAE